jgi:hypothetical protein
MIHYVEEPIIFKEECVSDFDSLMNEKDHLNHLNHLNDHTKYSS